jgi:hypothetical protein
MAACGPKINQLLIILRFIENAFPSDCYSLFLLSDVVKYAHCFDINGRKQNRKIEMQLNSNS